MTRPANGCSCYFYPSLAVGIDRFHVSRRSVSSSARSSTTSGCGAAAGRIHGGASTAAALRVFAQFPSHRPSPSLRTHHGRTQHRFLDDADDAGRDRGRGHRRRGRRRGPVDGRRRGVRSAAERHRERSDQPQRPESRAGPGRRPVTDHVHGRCPVPQLGTEPLRVRAQANDGR